MSVRHEVGFISMVGIGRHAYQAVLMDCETGRTPDEFDDEVWRREMMTAAKLLFVMRDSGWLAQAMTVFHPPGFAQ